MSGDAVRLLAIDSPKARVRAFVYHWRMQDRKNVIESIPVWDNLSGNYELDLTIHDLLAVLEPENYHAQTGEPE